MFVMHFTKEEMDIPLKPCVYVFYHGERVLYVGKGTSMSRPCDSGHHRRDDLTSADRLEIYACENEPDARAKEALMIAKLNPMLNQRREKIMTGGDSLVTVGSKSRIKPLILNR
jgi:excinuclease UvrABC nuclease subunit